KQSAKCKMQNAKLASASERRSPDAGVRGPNVEGVTQAPRLITRREVLTIGAAGVAGLAVARASAWQGQPELQAVRPPAARSVILLWMDGGPSQVDTFDPKPDAPSRWHGEFGAIRT